MAAVVHWEVAGEDLEALDLFYRELFGWQTTARDDEYHLVETGDGIGGGLMRCRNGVPPYVTFYVRVQDLEKSLRRVEELGGRRLVPPTPVGDVGGMALFRDPAGNVIGLWHDAG